MTKDSPRTSVLRDEELIARLDHWIEQQVLVLVDSDLLPIRDRIEQLVATNEALTEQRDAARQDAKEAEAYAGELEKELRDTQDRANAFATKEYYTEMRAERAEAKLAKLVEALEDLVRDCEADYPPSHGAIKYFCRAALAEIKGESHE